MNIYKVFTIDSAHRLPNVPSGHRCGRVHGHTFRIEIHLDGAIGDQTGWVVDFADIQKAFQPIHDLLDHNYLNDIEGLENPTSENIARWVWQRLKPTLPALCSIVVQESPQAGCVYHGEE
ncbi:MAG TPA: 6-carboxytetrahydropterin synthase QueD [Armatimonadota bacterium]|jgi:6-pyruvoyltetrahydropterin/6-carboxytetrahydropterin synthase